MDKAIFLKPKKIIPLVGLEGFYLRPMSAKAYLDIVGCNDTGNELNGMVRLVAASVCDADGQLVFKAEDHDDIANMDVQTLIAVSNQAMALNGMDVDDAKKN